MTYLKHTSALPSHYDKEAKDYDIFNEENSRHLNSLVESLLKKHACHTVLDMTCGTGSQVIWLKNKGFDVIGSDISNTMLTIAKNKTNNTNIFFEGDMRNFSTGKAFDAVITMFNAIGHLTKSDFLDAIKNIARNLKNGGIYIFDIFNAEYFLYSDNITKLTIDWQKTDPEGRKHRKIQYSTISHDGILASHTRSFNEIENHLSHMYEESQTLQIYNVDTLTSMLHQAGFTEIEIHTLDNTQFASHTTERMILLAHKR